MPYKIYTNFLCILMYMRDLKDPRIASADTHFFKMNIKQKRKKCSCSEISESKKKDETNSFVVNLKTKSNTKTRDKIIIETFKR